MQGAADRALPAPVTTDRAEYFPSLAADGTLYFSRVDENRHPALWMAEPEGDSYADPVKLPTTVNCGTDNYNAFVAPDESFIIVCVGGHPDNLGPADYWISYRGEDGTWQAARNLGEMFNGPDTRATSAFLSPDGHYLFFSSTRLAAAAADLPNRYNRMDLNQMHTEPGHGGSDIWWVSAEVLPSR